MVAALMVAGAAVPPPLPVQVSDPAARTQA